MTQEQKAKAYDEAWHKAKRIINVCVDDNTECRSMIACIQQIFPELKESEDERIRKELLEFLDELSKLGKNTNFDRWSKSDCADWIIWLEKQGETYTKKDIDNAYLEGMAFAKDELEKQNKQILANSAKTCKDEQQPTDNDMKELLHTEYEKGRADAIAEIQKPAWSEEDEEFLRRAINAAKDAYPMTAKWLKSLKERYTWKPSDEQMHMLKRMITALPTGEIHEGLVSLYNDLKKLKGE